MSEKKLQSKMVLKFSQEFPNRFGDLIGTFNETINAAQGANMLSLGLVKGLSDLIYINKDKRFVGIEVKYPNTYHDLIHILEQCRFLIENAHVGHFCISLEQFEKIIDSDGQFGGINPFEVRHICYEKIKSKMGEFNWDSVDDLIFEAHKWQKKTGKKLPKVKF